MTFRENQRVKIIDTDQTRRRFSINEKMVAMVGNIYKISSVMSQNDIMINGWHWHPKDLISVEDIIPECKKKEFTFNPEMLEV